MSFSIKNMRVTSLFAISNILGMLFHVDQFLSNRLFMDYNAVYKKDYLQSEMNSLKMPQEQGNVETYTRTRTRCNTYSLASGT